MIQGYISASYIMIEKASVDAIKENCKIDETSKVNSLEMVI